MRLSIPPRRTAVMALGIVIMGIGIALFKLSAFGNDPCSTMAMAAADKLGTRFSLTLLVFNCIFGIPELIWGRQYIGIGTLVNWFCVGFVTDFFYDRITAFTGTALALPGRIAALCIGIPVLGLACSLYQTADVGLGPYDALSVLLHGFTKIPYFWCRILFDSLCTAAAILLGGTVGIGTVVTALFFGPLVAFWTRTVACRMCGIDSKFV